MPDITLQHPLPASAEAERLCLGVTLLENKTLPQMCDVLKPADFFFQQNQLIFTAIDRIYRRGQSVDPLVVQEELRRLEIPNALELAGGPATIAGLFDGVPRFSNIENYAGLIKDKAQKRRLIHQSQLAMNRAFADDCEAGELLAETISAIEAIAAEVMTDDLISSEDASNATLTWLESNWARGDGLLGVSTGLPKLDKILLGLQRGQLYTLAASTGLGKTALALNIAWNVVTNGFNVLQRPPVILFITLEMQVEELYPRLWARITDIDLTRIFTGKDLTHAERSAIMLAAGETSHAHIRLNKGDQAITPRGLAARIEKVRREFGFVDLVIVDYLHLLDPDNPVESEQVRLSQLSRAMKLCAKRFNVPLLLLSQLNRASQGVNPRDPVLSDLRGSGTIEQDSNVVMFIAREDWRAPDDDNRRKLIVAKQRGGQTGDVPAVFLGSRQLFGERELTEVERAARDKRAARKLTKAGQAAQASWLDSFGNESENEDNGDPHQEQ